MESYMIYIWLILVVLFTVIESATINIVTMWFAVGAISAVVVNLLGGGINSQLIMFLTVSVISLVLLRPIVTKLLKTTNVEKFNNDALIGKACIVTEDTKKDSIGSVELEGRTWRAKDVDNGELRKEEKVIVVSITGATLNVKKVDEV